MRLNEYEKAARREIESWQNGETSILHQALNWSMAPVDWVVDSVVPAAVLDQASDAVSEFLSVLNDASEWTFDEADVLARARSAGLDVESLEALRDQPLDLLDRVGRNAFDENSVLAAIEGAGFGFGGAILIAADIPVLFTINFRMIQQIGGLYGFSLRKPQYRPLVLHLFNVAASGSRSAKYEALKEISVAGASFAHGMDYRGRASSGTFREQNRHLPREIAKQLLGRKLAQMVPIAGAAVGAGVNYWFTTQTAEAAFMLFRYMYLERKERM